MDLTSLLLGYSKALYSNWLFYKPDRLLIDCGEGVASTLGNGGYAIERILLTHGHIDHIAGLPVFLWTRAAGMGDTQKPLEIYQPAGDPYLADMERFLERTRHKLPYELKWHKLQAQEEFSLCRKRRVRTFATEHAPSQLTLGYKILETRRRLRPEFAGIEEKELRALVQSKGREAVDELMENYTATIAAFSGDSLPLDPGEVRGAELLVHEATLLNEAQRRFARHATLQEAVEVAARAEAKVLLLHHISARYTKQEIERTALHAADKYGFKNPIWCLFHQHLWQIQPRKGAKRREKSLEKVDK